jgi:hypothetical protein
VSHAAILLARQPPFTVLVLTPPAALHGSRQRALGDRAATRVIAGPGQQCSASGWNIGQVLCGDFLIFNFCLLFQKSLSTSKMSRKYNTTQKNTRQIFVYSLRAALHIEINFTPCCSIKHCTKFHKLKS